MVRLRVPGRGLRDRRGRLGRRARDRRRRPRADAGALDLLGDLARGLRHDPLARRQPAPKAAAAFKPTARFCYDLGVVDTVVAEPSGGAHKDHDRAAQLLGDAIAQALDSIEAEPIDQRRAACAARSSGAWACGSRTASWWARRSRTPSRPRPPAELSAAQSSKPASPRPRSPQRGSCRRRSGRPPRPAASRRRTGSSRARAARARARPPAPGRAAGSAASRR